MAEHLPDSAVRSVAWTHLNVLRTTGVLPSKFEGLAIARSGDPVHDLNGEVLFHRVPLERDGQTVAFADIAVHPALGHPFLAVSDGTWSGRQALRDGAEAARAFGVRFDGARLVAYSYPKLAVQFLAGREEVLLLELFSWTPVPPGQPRGDRPPGDFERWSLLESIGGRARENEERYAAHVRGLGEWLEGALRQDRGGYEGPGAATAAPAGLSLPALEHPSVSQTLYGPLFPIWLLGAHRDLHYSLRNTDHQVCYEVRGQETSVWCVAASTQMLLDFYRYQYTQDRLAAEMGLGTKVAPNGLPYGSEWKVVAALQNLTGGALTAAENDTPYYDQFVSEIDANRPLISFIPGHSRTVAGYWWSLLPFGGQPTSGLLVYDPWPPNAGVITRYENYATQTYRVTFTAHVTTVP